MVKHEGGRHALDGRGGPFALDPIVRWQTSSPSSSQEKIKMVYVPANAHFLFYS
jgi:hypothetical protein